MNKPLSRFIQLLGISMVAIAMFGCAEMQGGGSGSGGHGGYSESASSPSGADVASGTQGDTLEACLGRIPSNSTDSQRMLAELSCKRDEEARRPINAVPGK